VIQNV